MSGSSIIQFYVWIVFYYHCMQLNEEVQPQLQKWCYIIHKEDFVAPENWNVFHDLLMLTYWAGGCGVNSNPTCFINQEWFSSWMLMTPPLYMLCASTGAVLPYVAAVAHYCHSCGTCIPVTPARWLPACPGARLWCPGGVYQHPRSPGCWWKKKVISSFLMMLQLSSGGGWRKR